MTVKLLFPPVEELKTKFNGGTIAGHGGGGGGVGTFETGSVLGDKHCRICGGDGILGGTNKGGGGGGIGTVESGGSGIGKIFPESLS